MLLTYCINLHPDWAVRIPENNYLLVQAIEDNHPLIHTFLQKWGIGLLSRCGSWHFDCPPYTPLGDFIAFHSRDEKLLAKLSTLKMRNRYGMTPTHYAVLTVFSPPDYLLLVVFMIMFFVESLFVLLSLQFGAF